MHLGNVLKRAMEKDIDRSVRKAAAIHFDENQPHFSSDPYFPAAFDANYYRSTVRGIRNDAQALEHFQTKGRQTGRPGSIGCSKNWLLQRLGAMKDGAKLEIGPGSKPALSGDGVYYFDVKNYDQLKERYKDTDDVKNVPTKIHYVNPNGDLRSIDRQFNLVFSSHVIEHTADLIDHFEDVSALLSDGGYYVLYVPDKRYCFDHFKPETSFEEVLAQHTLDDGGWSRFLKCYLLENTRRAHNKSREHWKGHHGSYALDRKTLDHAVFSARETFEDPIRRFGHHNWFFSDISFERIVRNLFELKYISLEPIAVYNTIRGSIEFCAVFKKKE